MAANALVYIAGRYCIGIVGNRLVYIAGGILDFYQLMTF